MNETNVKVSFNNSVTNAKKLDTYAEKLKEIYGILSAIDKGQLAQLGDFNITLTKVKDNAQNLGKNTSNFAKNMNTAFNIGKIALFSKKIYGLGRGIAELTTKSSAYVENLNLLEVAYANINRKTGEFNEDIKVTSGRIEKLISNMSEVYGLDESDLARTFGIFKQLANAMELPTKTAEQLSELMVKMRQDIASLYNLDLDRAGNALQSALAGQVRPIRTATGADITEKTLQKTVDNLGLDTTINKLSFVEKRLIMVISLTNQLKNSQGDYGRTIESIANQTKVLHDQWERLTRAIGNVFNPLIKSILPVVNGVLMALTEIFNIIASLVGFKLDEFDYSGLAGVSDTALNLEENLNGAGKEVDKLKTKLSGLRSFDKLNVISTPKSTSSGAGSGSGTIDPKILEAFSKAFGEYDDMLGKVKMKANDIRDAIMEWLGFTKEVNPLTGEVEYKYKGIGKFLQNILNTFLKMKPILKIITIGLATFTGVKIAKGIQNLIIGFKTLTGYAQKNGKTLEILKGVNKTNIEYWKKHTSVLQKFTNILIGSAGVVMGLNMVSDAMKNIQDEGISLGNTLEGLGGIMLSVFGGALIGSQFGFWGGVIGGIAGAVGALITAIQNYKSETDKLVEDSEKHKIANEKALQSYKDFKEGLENEMNGLLAGQSYRQQLLDELGSLVDENGNLIQGYEDRANFILNELNTAYGTEYKLADLQAGKYKEIKKNIDDIIASEKARIILEANKEAYAKAIQEEWKAYYRLKDAQAEQEKAENTLAKLKQEMEKLLDKEGKGLYDVIEYTSILTGEHYTGMEAYQKLKEEIEDYTKILDNNTKSVESANEEYIGYKKDIIYYEDLSTAILKNDIAKQEEIIKSYTKTVETESGTRQATAKDELDKLERDFQIKKEIYATQGKNVSDAEITAYLNKKHQLEEIIDSEEKNTQTHYDTMVEKAKTFDENLNKTIGNNTYTIKFDTNLPDVAKTINKFAGQLQGSALVKSKIIDINASNPFSNPYAFKVSNYAGGGFLPPVGNMFVMNEKEPELLGTIGGKSFVANQNQMMDLLDKKIGNAQKNTGTQVINLYLDADHKIGSYTLEQLQNMAKTDGKPITIG